MTESPQVLELLGCFPLLADLPPELLQQLASQGQLLRFKLGQPISRCDQAPNQLFFLVQGSVRSVVMANRLPRGVATLERLEAGALLNWTPLSCGRCWESLIASTDLVVVAIPLGAIQQVMQAYPPLAQRLNSSVHPAELFAVLDAHLLDYPRARAEELRPQPWKWPPAVVPAIWRPLNSTN